MAFERVDMLLLIFENLAEQVAADIVLDLLAMGDGALELGQRLQFEGEVAFQHFLDILTDPELAEQLEIGKAVEEQDPLGQLVGMLHLVDRLMPLELGGLGDSPIFEHPIMQPILVDRGQLVLERFVEELNDLLVALHRGLLKMPPPYARGAGKGSKKVAEISEK